MLRSISFTFYYVTVMCVAMGSVGNVYSEEQPREANTVLKENSDSASWAPYDPVEKRLSGRVQIAADTVVALLAKAIGFELREYYPNLDIQTYSLAAGSTREWWKQPSAVAMLAGTMSEVELKEFQRRKPYLPVHFPVATSAVAVIVHPSNPIAQEGLSLAQLDAIFSSTRNRGHAEVSLWGDVGLTEQWQHEPVYPYQLDQTHILYEFFRRNVLKGGEFKPRVIREATPSELIERIATGDEPGAREEGNTEAIGFISMHDLTHSTSQSIVAVPIRKESTNSELSYPTPKDVKEGRYPLRHFVYLYFDAPSYDKLSTEQRELLKLILSRQGQSLVVENGYVPVPLNIAQEKLAPIKSSSKVPANQNGN